MTAMTPVSTDILVIGAGGAGMYAAIAAAQNGAQVIIVDKNMVGRGGATIMAQMTVAAALSEQAPDRWETHYEDTLAAGRELCDATMAELVCQHAPTRMREMDDWGVGWARADNHISQVMAPGHQVARCCYVDFLNTGPAVARTLRRKIGRADAIRRVSDVVITELIIVGGEVCGAIGVEGIEGKQITIIARAVIIATGGLTKLFARSSASNNMVGEGYALGMRAGAELIDMEFVQFFPIGHLAPRLVGMDPIMWDPFRYKLGGRLLNGEMQEFMESWGNEDQGSYTTPRDQATYAIYKENEAGRGSPHGGAWLSFTHIPEKQLRDAFGPVVDKLAKNGIDLLTQAIEVSPIAHYHMGGIKVDARMQTRVPGLFAAGEATGGASGANRLSGNAISEALVLGEIAGREAAHYATTAALVDISNVKEATIVPAHGDPGERRSATAMMHELKQIMWQQVGPFRDKNGLSEALNKIKLMKKELSELPVNKNQTFANTLFDWHELDVALTVAQCVAYAALRREESRGAHQRNDFPQTDPNLALSQHITQQINAGVNDDHPLDIRTQGIL